MRIVSLELRRYGIFEKTSVEFGPGCTLVYGPNEAGKSTLLHALGDFLWGIESRKHPHQHTHTARPKDMQLTSKVEVLAGPSTLTRHLKKLIDADAQEVPCSWNSAGDVSRDVWNLTFGLDLDQLQSGGREVMDGEGDLADLIFLAETGQIVEKVRANLGDRLEAIYKQHRGAKSVEVRKVLGKVDQVTEKIQEHLVNAPAVDQAREELETARRRSKRFRTEQDQLDLRLDRARELERCFGTAAELVGVEARLAQARAEGRSLSPDEYRRLDEALLEVDRLEGQIRDKKLDRDGEQRALEALQLRPDLERSSEAITRVQNGVGTARKAQQEASNKDLQRAAQGQVRELLESLGQTTVDDLTSGVAEVRVSVEQRSQLDATAERAVKARERVQAAASELKQAEERLEILQRTDSQRQDRGVLQDARDHRDESWNRIREPWLSGDLPPKDERTQAAADMGNTMTTADRVAESLTDELSEAAETRGKVQQAHHQVHDISARLASASDDLNLALQDWNGFAETCGLTPGLAPEHWKARGIVLDQLVAAWDGLQLATRHRQESAEEFEGFVQQVDELHLLLHEAPQDPFDSARQLHEALKMAEKAGSAAGVHRGKMDKVDKQIRSLEDECDSAQEVISTLAAEPGDVASILRDQSRAVLGLESDRQNLIDQLSGQRDPGSDLNILREELTGRSQEDLRSRISDTDAAKDAIRQDLESANEDVSGKKAELELLERGKSTAALNSELMEHGTRLANLLREFRLLSTQAILLDAYKKDLAERHDSPMLSTAGRYLEKLTDGRFTGFTTVVSGETREVRVLRSSEDSPTGTEEMEVAHLSEGTADQVFLALRLAGIQEREHKLSATGAEALPVVLDDILMAFDDNRATAALRLLADLGEEFQIILLTHHQHVVELSESIDGIAVAELA